MLTVEALGLVKTACCTGTLFAPDSWLEFPGGLEPWLAATVTGVGVKLGVMVGVLVAVLVFVGVAVACATVMVDPETGRPLNWVAWPFVPDAPVKLKV
jgi:hypothetical protein